MGWVQRGKHCYYRRSCRIHGKVHTQFCGRGEAAQRAYQADLERRQNRQKEQAERRDLQAQEEAVTKAISNYSKLVDLLVQASLIDRGFWQHDRGAWRLKRNAN